MTTGTPIVTSRTETTDHDVTVSAPFDGNGQALAVSTESVAVMLRNVSAPPLGAFAEALYRVDDGDWATLPVGARVSLAVDLSTQTITLKRAEYSENCTVRATVTEVPSGLYAEGKALGGGPGGGSSSGTLGAVQLSDGAGGFSSNIGISFDAELFVQGIRSPSGIATFSANGGTAVLIIDDAGATSLTASDGTTGIAFNPTFGTIISDLWAIVNATGGIIPVAPNVQDIGAVGTEVRTGYFGTSVVTPDVVMSSGAASVIILPTADPSVPNAIWNNAGTVEVSAGALRQESGGNLLQENGGRVLLQQAGAPDLRITELPEASGPIAHGTSILTGNEPIAIVRNGVTVQTETQEIANLTSGVVGPAGPAGPQGATGSTGADGAAGATGATGPAGVAGTQGPQGVQGAAGATGSTGAQGTQGDPGPAGTAGATGAQGPQGATGATGTQGPQGPAGLLPGVATTGDFVIGGGANVLVDVPGLSFAVLAGKSYWFSMLGFYTADANTSGSRWSVNGPAMNWIGYRSTYGNTGLTVTDNPELIGLQQPAGASTGSNAAGNLVRIEGIFNAAANGNFQIQAAREVGTGTITLKPGATLHYRQTTP